MAVLLLSLFACGPPQVELDAEYVLMSYGDGSVVALDKGTPEFDGMADEAIRIFQYTGLAASCYFGPEQIEAIKSESNFVDIGFDGAVEMPVKPFKGQDKTTEDGYVMFELVSALFPLSGKYKGHVLYRPDERYETWYCFKAARTFSKLENMAYAMGMTK